ncbi:Oidioi.mRNA.OKI2018_I69.PAR.g11606.t1.cds [Oikopleura dioica]|uniref:Oidioi.mRNA.OKI2018_I69.PAR.g11606.t1.cds n=1 Tax=Oikopleura dioica TaxID=34765 RepID=A0ABN7RWH4_OIKDI|nr:Oidioi.mRNA.OKI2018_I69.PAR.g11606.t1.cds [Oikopleura dioica]
MDEKKDNKGFDEIWDYVPGFSARQLFLTVITGLISFQDGYITMWPIFAVYTPKTYYCNSDARLTANYQANQTLYNGVPDLCATTDYCLVDGFDNLTDHSRKRRSGGGGGGSGKSEGVCGIVKIDNFLPGIASNDSCKRCHQFEEFANSNVQLDDERDLCPDEYYYSDEFINETLVTDFHLVCDKQVVRETVFSLGGVGLAIGSFVGGGLTDTLGRKKVMLYATLLMVITIGIAGWANNLLVIMIFWTLTKILSQVKYLAYSSFTLEIVSPSWRAFAGQMNHIYYALGCITASVFSYYFRDWRSFTFATTAVCAPLLLFWICVPESPRWLILKRRSSEAKDAIRKLIGANAEKIDSSFYKNIENAELEELEEEVEEFAGSTHIGSMGSLVKSSLSLNKRPSVAYTGTLGLIKEEDSFNELEEKTFKDIFRFPVFRNALFIIFFAFFVIAMVFMGISYNAAELPGTIWANNAINGLLDCVAQFIIIVVMQKIGRRHLLFGVLWGTGITYMASEIVLQQLDLENMDESEISLIKNSSRWLAFTGKFFISAAFSVIYTYSAEVFPTTVRTIALGFGSLGGGLGNVIAPYILQLQKPPISIRWLPAAIFSASCVLVAFFLLLLPETKGKALYETMAEAEKVYKNKSQKMPDNEDRSLYEPVDTA